jgi:hypothetical protein
MWQVNWGVAEISHNRFVQVDIPSNRSDIDITNA